MYTIQLSLVSAKYLWFSALIPGIIARSPLWKVNDSDTKTIDSPSITLASGDSLIYAEISFYVFCLIPGGFQI